MGSLWSADNRVKFRYPYGGGLVIGEERGSEVRCEKLASSLSSRLKYEETN
jgi:hypothetical protein